MSKDSQHTARWATDVGSKSVLPLQCMLDQVPTVSLVQAVMGGPEGKGLVHVDLTSESFSTYKLKLPSFTVIRSVLDGILEFASSSSLLKYLPKEIDGVEAVDFVAALTLYSMETPFPFYLLTSLPLNVQGVRKVEALECQLPYLKLLILVTKIIPRDCEYWHDGVIFRGIDVGKNPSLLKKYDDYERAFASGTKITFAAPTSTTTKDKIARKFTKGIQYVIQGYGGKGGVGGVLLKPEDVSAFEEDEVLLMPPITFEVVAATKIEKTIIVVIKAVSSKMTYLSDLKVLPPLIRLPAGTILGADVLKDPKCVAMDQEGRILVTDFGLHQIIVFNTDGSVARLLGSNGGAPGQFNGPVGIALDRQGRIVVADLNNHRIQVLNRDGSVARCFGSEGTAVGRLKQPYGVAVVGEERIVVTDYSNHRVQVFNADGSVACLFGSCGEAVGDFDFPTGVAVDGAGRIVVADSENDRVQVFNGDGSVALCFGSRGPGPGQLKDPTDVAVDREGRFVVADCGNNRVQVFNSDGSAARVIGAGGAGVGQLKSPYGMAVDGAGRILVVDGGNHRVQVF